MLDKNKSNKQKENKEQNNNKYNKASIGSHTGIVDKNGKSTIKINNRIYNLKNIDNNMSRGNLNENIMSHNSLIPQFFLCQQTNIHLISHIKKFNISSLISDSSIHFSYNYKEPIKPNEISNIEKKEIDKCKYVINSSNIFIEGEHNLKPKTIKVINSSKKDNLVHLEISELMNNQSVKLENEKNKLFYSLEIINKRWNETQKESKIRLSFLNKTTKIINDLEKYKEELMSKINFETNKLNDNKNTYIFLKQDIKRENDQIIHKLINTTSKKEFEVLLNQFIRDDDIESNINNKNNSNKDEILHNNMKKKSKFILQNSLNKNTNNNMKSKSEDYCPILIFNYNQIRNFINEIIKNLNLEEEIKTTQKNCQNIIEQNESINYKSNNNNDNENRKKSQQIKNVKFENMSIKKNIDLKIINNDNNDINKKKEKSKKEFGQCTPISLLKEKYFIYAVSKWSKFSSINSNINLFIQKSKSSTKNQKFESNNLKLSNFYMIIENVILEKDIKKAANNSNILKKNIFLNGVEKHSNRKNVIPKTKSFISNFNKNDKEVSNIQKKIKSKSKLKKK